MIKRLFAVLLIGLFAGSIASAAPKVRWPRDVVEWENYKAALKTAKEEEKGFAFIFVPSEWPDDEDGGVARSVEATNDAIAKLKTFCLIVKGQMNPVMKVLQGEENKFEIPKALLTGFTKAGNSYPLVVVLDGEMNVILGATGGTQIYNEGAKVFRDAKKQFRDLLDAKTKEEKK